MINCNLRQDIAIGGGSGCMLSDINAGIQDGLYIFNLDDVKGLIFEDDSRPDSSLTVDTIITSMPYYRVDATSIGFSEEYQDHYYHQQLTATVASVRNTIEEVLQGAVHGKYLIAFKVVGETHYRLVGWKEGLSLDETLSIATDDNSFNLTFEGDTTYPMMEVNKDNFNISNKVYEPMFEPLFAVGDVICSDGWAVAKYVVKVNAAGQALDTNNKLCQYSLLSQDAYKLYSVADGGYHIIGTYGQNDYIEGKAVRKYDATLCSVSGTMTISPSTVTLNSSSTGATLTVNSSSDWELITYPSYVDVSRVGGSSDDHTINLYSTSNCGSEILTFRNRLTRQTANVTINNQRINLGSTYTYPNGTTRVSLAPTTCLDYSITTTAGSAIKNSNGSFTISGIPTSTDQQTVTVTLSSGTETKQVNLIILGTDASRHAKAISEWCETN